LKFVRPSTMWKRFPTPSTNAKVDFTAKSNKKLKELNTLGALTLAKETAEVHCKCEKLVKFNHPKKQGRNGRF